MAKSKFKCPRCDRTFTMKAHLARHLSATHGAKKKKAAKKTAKRGKKRKAKARFKRRGVTRLGRPKGIASQVGLRSLTLEQLGELVTAARAEARHRLAALKKAMT
jgi:uncharacterized C2H2 Zn-finger protein